MSCSYRFKKSSLSIEDYNIIIRQQPERAKISSNSCREKRAIEPPPILQLKWLNSTEEDNSKYIQNPFYFMMVHILNVNDSDDILPINDYLSGSTVSSLYKLKDIDKKEGGFFIFNDLIVKKEGHFKLRFSLFEIKNELVENCKNISSNTFYAYTTKNYPGPIQSTLLSNLFLSQGIKIRIKRGIIPASTEKTNRRKRKYDTLLVMPSRKWPYSYAAEHDVHFGRWQVQNSPETLSPNLSIKTSSFVLPPIIDSVSEQNQNKLPPLNEIVKNIHKNQYNLLPVEHSLFK